MSKGPFTARINQIDTAENFHILQVEQLTEQFFHWSEGDVESSRRRTAFFFALRRRYYLLPSGRRVCHYGNAAFGRTCRTLV